MSFRSFFAWFGCRHRDPMFDRVKGRAVWRCASCGAVREILA